MLSTSWQRRTLSGRYLSNHQQRVKELLFPNVAGLGLGYATFFFSIMFAENNTTMKTPPHRRLRKLRGADDDSADLGNVTDQISESPLALTKPPSTCSHCSSSHLLLMRKISIRHMMITIWSLILLLLPDSD